MPVHKTMTPQDGHKRDVWDKADVVGVQAAEARFRELTGKGFVALELGKDGAPGRLLKGFDPSVEETLFQPQLEGG